MKEYLLINGMNQQKKEQGDEAVIFHRGCNTGKNISSILIRKT